jgi:hypothetical protein
MVKADDRISWEELGGQLLMPDAEVGGVGGASRARMIAKYCLRRADGR